METSRLHPGAAVGTALCWALAPRGSKLSQAPLNAHNKEGFELATKTEPEQSQREHIFISRGCKRKGRKPDTSQITLLSLAVS